MVVTAKRNNMRLIAVVLGESVSKTRNSETTNLLDFGFNSYKINLVKQKGEIVDSIKIDKANVDKINVVVESDVSILNKKSDISIDYDTEIKLNDIKLPLKKGDIVGKIILKYNDKQISTQSLIVDQDVKKINFFKYYFNNIIDIIGGNVI